MPPGLTTTRAEFVARAIREGRLYITQPYDLYTPENHDVWRRLFARMLPQWRAYANDVFLRGLEALSLDPQRIPRLVDVNQFMEPRTGFRAIAVAGYAPAPQFFARLSQREFPTTITIRDGTTLDYLPEPDIFHDIAGHVPMHMDADFADAIVRIGACSARAARRVSKLPADQREQRLANIQRALARFFWFTVEFGLMRSPTRGSVKAYGSGLLSSYGELEHALTSPEVERRPFDLERVVNQPFDIDRYQPLLFVIDDFHHLLAVVRTLESWLDEGYLDDVAPDAADAPDAA